MKYNIKSLTGFKCEIESEDYLTCLQIKTIIKQKYNNKLLTIEQTLLSRNNDDPYGKCIELKDDEIVKSEDIYLVSNFNFTDSEEVVLSKTFGKLQLSDDVQRYIIENSSDEDFIKNRDINNIKRNSKILIEALRKFNEENSSFEIVEAKYKCWKIENRDDKEYLTYDVSKDLIQSILSLSKIEDNKCYIDFNALTSLIHKAQKYSKIFNISPV